MSIERLLEASAGGRNAWLNEKFKPIPPVVTPKPYKAPTPPKLINTHTAPKPSPRMGVRTGPNPRMPSLLPKVNPSPATTAPKPVKTPAAAKPAKPVSLQNSKAYHAGRANYHQQVAESMKPHILSQVKSFIDSPTKHLAKMHKLNQKLAHHSSLAQYHIGRLNELEGG